MSEIKDRIGTEIDMGIEYKEADCAEQALDRLLASLTAHVRMLKEQRDLFRMLGGDPREFDTMLREALKGPPTGRRGGRSWPA